MKTKTNHGAEIELAQTSKPLPVIFIYSDDPKTADKGGVLDSMPWMNAKWLHRNSPPWVFAGLHPCFVVRVLPGETLPPELRLLILKSGGLISYSAS